MNSPYEPTAAEEQASEDWSCLRDFLRAIGAMPVRQVWATSGLAGRVEDEDEF